MHCTCVRRGYTQRDPFSLPISVAAPGLKVRDPKVLLIPTGFFRPTTPTLSNYESLTTLKEWSRKFVLSIARCLSPPPSLPLEPLFLLSP